MIRHAFFSLLIFLFFQNMHAQNEVVYLENPSFEGLPQAGTVGDFDLEEWSDCGFVRETAPDILPIEGGNNFRVHHDPYGGDTYLGMVVRENETWERIGQRLVSPLQKNMKYEFSIHLCRSLTYTSINKADGRMRNFVVPVVFRIWGGNGQCERKELLAESGSIKNSEWEEYDFELTPTDSFQYILFEAYYETPTPFPYNGHILLDDASNFVPIGKVKSMVQLEEAESEKKPQYWNETLHADDEFFGEKFKLSVFPKLDSEGKGQKELAQKAIDAALNRAEEIENNVERDLELLRDNAEENKGIVPGDDLWFILNFAMETRERTEGTFDVTMREVEKLWKESAKEKKKPAPAKINRLRREAGMSQIVIDKEAGGVRLLSSRLPLDLEGLARGYILDNMADVLYESGHKSFFIESGKIAVAGETPDASNKWKYKRPVFIYGNRAVEETPIWNSAIVTAEPAKVLFEKYGDKFYDIVDPVTGEVIRHQSIVTVEAASAMNAYAWAMSLTINYDDDFYSWLKKQDTIVWYSEP